MVTVKPGSKREYEHYTIMVGQAEEIRPMDSYKRQLEDQDGFTTVDLGNTDTAPERKADTETRSDTEPVEGKECQPCNRNDEQSSAVGFCIDCDEFVCENCWKVHLKIRTLNKHSVIALTKDGYSVEYTNTHAPNASKIPKKLCLTHDGELLEYYCTQCVVLACSRCVKDSHSNCNTAHIPDLSKYVSKSDGFDESDIRKLIKGINATETGLTDVQKQLKDNISNIDRKHSDVAKECKLFLTDVDSFIKEILDYILETAKCQGDEEIKRIEDTKMRVRSALTEYKRLHDELKEMENSPAKRNESNLSRILNSMNKIKHILTDNLAHNKPKPHTKAFGDLDSFYNFVEAIRDFASYTDIIPMPKEAVADFSTETDTDTQPNVITGCLKTKEGLIIADRGNGKLKVFDTIKGKLVAEMQYRY